MPAWPIDEHAPLLANPEPESEAQAVELSGTIAEGHTCWSIAWCTVLAILTICVLLVFIKGVIDSDDIEVSIPLAIRLWN